MNKISIIEKFKGFIKEKYLDRVIDEDIFLFTRELAAFLDVGITLDKSLKALSEYHIKKRMREIISDVRMHLRNGWTLTNSMWIYRKVFSYTYIAMMEVGEKTGELPMILLDLANTIEWEILNKKRITSMLVYPIFVMTITFIILMGMIIIFVKPFVGFLEGLHVELPLITKILVNIMHFFQDPTAIMTLVILIISFVFLFHSFKSTIMGKLFINSLKINLPVIGQLFIKIDMIKFIRAFCIMNKSGINIPTTLSVAIRVVDNQSIADVLEHCLYEIINGVPFVKAFKNKKYISSLMIAFFNLGYETGDLSEALEQLANVYNEDIYCQLDTIVKLIEPVYLIVISGFVAFTVLAIYIPLYRLVSAVGD